MISSSISLISIDCIVNEQCIFFNTETVYFLLLFLLFLDSGPKAMFDNTI